MSISKKTLFTPGPINTLASVKNAMLHDVGSRDPEFIAVTSEIREKLLRFSEAEPYHYTAVLLPGAGTMMLEAVFGSCIDDQDELLILHNGAYGKRLLSIAQHLRLHHHVLEFPENAGFDLDRVNEFLLRHRHCKCLAMVHCETSSGILNNLEGVVALCKERGVELFVDAMSSFGGIPLSVGKLGIACVISSANKCLEGVPGVAFTIIHKTLLTNRSAVAKSYSLDLKKQWQSLENCGQFRFTPSTHVMLALQQALNELDEEGGIDRRFRRYVAMQEVLLHCASNVPLEPVIKRALRSPVITAFHYPDIGGFDFDTLYRSLAC